MTQTHAAVVAMLARDFEQSLPPLDETAQRVSLALYRALAEGQPVRPEELALRESVDITVIAGLLDTWPAVHRDETGAVIGYWGLSLGGTKHAVHVRGVDLTMWCAFDTLFIAELLQREVRVVSPCAETGTEICFTAHPDGNIDVTSPLRADSVVLSFLEPSDRIGDNVISAFCHHVHFFSGRDAGERWIHARPESFLLSLDEGVELARMANRHRYPGLLQAEETRS